MYVQVVFEDQDELINEITAYLLVPDPSLSERAAKLELETAVRYLAHETNASQQRKVATHTARRTQRESDSD